MKRRPSIPRIVVLLLLGAIVNVAVAWVCAILMPFSATHHLPLPPCDRCANRGAVNGREGAR